MNTVYQFWIHTKSVGKLPAVVEWLLNTPSHHRVHHDRRVHKNYAEIFIVWDRSPSLACHPLFYLRISVVLRDATCMRGDAPPYLSMYLSL